MPTRRHKTRWVNATCRALRDMEIAGVKVRQSHVLKQNGIAGIDRDQCVVARGCGSEDNLVHCHRNSYFGDSALNSHAAGVSLVHSVEAKQTQAEAARAGKD